MQAESATEEAAEAAEKLRQAQAKFAAEFQDESSETAASREGEGEQEDGIDSAISAATAVAESLVEPEPEPAPEPQPQPEPPSAALAAVEKHSPGISVDSSAEEICAAFFSAMDINSNGYLEEEEMLEISEVAFGESTEDSMIRWNKMLEDMDKDHDGQISMKEYTSWWLADTKRHQTKDGKFVTGYANYLIGSLGRLQHFKKELNGEIAATVLCEAFFDSLDVVS